MLCAGSADLDHDLIERDDDVVSYMIFVQNFTAPDFYAKSFTLQKCVICDIFLAN